MAVTIYHNPNCSKSRGTLAMLEARELHPRVVEYLDAPPDLATLERLAELLGGARAFVRTNEGAWAAAGLDDASDDESILRAMVEHPILIERPIVVVDDARAAIGRPPERVLDIL